MTENAATTPATEVASYSEEAAAQELLSRWNRKPEGDPEDTETEVQAPEGEQPEPEQADEAQAPETEEAPAAETEWEVEFGGQVRKLPKGIPEEVARTVQEFGQSLHADYTRKTQEVAQTRAKAQADAQAAAELLRITEEQSDLIADARMVQRQIEAISQIDLYALSESDPLKAQQHMARLVQLQQAKQSIDAALQTKIIERQGKEAQAAHERMAEAQATLQREIKEWGPQTQQALRQYGQSIGFSEAELSQVADPRFVVLLHKAQQFDALKSSAASTVKRVSTPAKTLKPSAAGTAQSIHKSQADDAMKRLSRTGKVADAAAAILARSKR